MSLIASERKKPGANNPRFSICLSAVLQAAIGRTVAPPGPSEAGRMPGHRRGGGGAAGRQGPAWAPVYCQSRADDRATGRA